MLNGSVKAWHDMTSKWNQAGYPYIPNLSVQWDSSPRTVVSDTFELGGYPFTGTFRSTPDEWKTALQAGKQFLDATCKNDGTWCPMTINAWNEVSTASSIHKTLYMLAALPGSARTILISDATCWCGMLFACSGARAHISSQTCGTARQN